MEVNSEVQPTSVGAHAAPEGRSERRRKLGFAPRIALAVIALIGALVTLGPLVLGDPNVGNTAQRLIPLGTGGHLLGTDGQGRDVVARIAAGGRLTMIAGLVPVAFAAVIGTLLGVAAGLARPLTHKLIMRTLDVFYAFPAVLLAIAIAAALGSGMSNSVIALAVIMVPPVARVAETETRRLTALDYMEAARASGATQWAIATRQVLPSVAPAVVVYCTALIGLSIVYAAGLSFLGLGVSPPTAEWGLMVAEGTQFLHSMPALPVTPAIAILVVSVAFNVLGDGLRDMLDVRTEIR